MTTVILQPTYLPWVGYFDMIDRADLFVILDNVQFEKQAWQQRNKIKTGVGTWKWLTVPVVQNFQQLLNKTRIKNDQKWKKKHWKTIQQFYCKSVYWEDYSAKFDEIYSKNWELLIDLNINIIQYLINEFGINVKILRSSLLNLPGKNVNYLINICNYLKTDTYLSPPRAACYIEKNNLFLDEGINLVYHNYKHPKYNQQFGEFIPYMSSIDLLFNEGINSLNIIKSGRIEISERIL